MKQDPTQEYKRLECRMAVQADSIVGTVKVMLENATPSPFIVNVLRKEVQRYDDLKVAHKKAMDAAAGI